MGAHIRFTSLRGRPLDRDSRWSRRGRKVLLGKQDLPKSATAPASGWDRLADGAVVY